MAGLLELELGDALLPSPRPGAGGNASSVGGFLSRAGNAVGDAYRFVMDSPERIRQQTYEYAVSQGMPPNMAAAAADRVAGRAGRVTGAIDLMIPQTPADVALTAAGPLGRLAPAAGRAALMTAGGLLGMEPGVAEAGRGDVARGARNVVQRVVDSVSPARPTRSSAVPSVIDEWQWRPNADVMADLNLREMPEHVQEFGRFMRGQVDRADSGEMGIRDLQKAFAITRASIQRQALPVERIRDAGLPLPGESGRIRPEGAMAEWLGTPYGQRYLDAAGRGEVDEEAILNAMQVMRPFGKHNDIGDALRYGATQLPGREAEATTAISNLYRAPAAIDQWRDFGKSLRGIGPSKQGFVGSLLGAGADPTLDARQIILHTGRPTSEASSYIARRGGLGGDQAVDRLALRQQEMAFQLPPELRPFYQHLTHHAVWDRAGNEVTTHADVMRAMRLYGMLPGMVGGAGAAGLLGGAEGASEQ